MAESSIGIDYYSLIILREHMEGGYSLLLKYYTQVQWKYYPLGGRVR